VAWTRRRPKPGHQPVDLRSRLFELDPASIGLRPSPALPNVWAAIMELGFADGSATIVSLADGSTSLYTSEGGGVIGGGEHESVARASRQFVADSERHLDRFEPDDTHELPPPDFVCFRALTYTERRSASAREQDLVSGQHELSPLYATAQSVITALREAEEAGR
jgi:hypothetical protein